MVGSACASEAAYITQSPPHPGLARVCRAPWVFTPPPGSALAVWIRSPPFAGEGPCDVCRPSPIATAVYKWNGAAGAWPNTYETNLLLINSFRPTLKQPHVWKAAVFPQLNKQKGLVHTKRSWEMLKSQQRTIILHNY